MEDTPQRERTERCFNTPLLNRCDNREKEREREREQRERMREGERERGKKQRERRRKKERKTEREGEGLTGGSGCYFMSQNKDFCKGREKAQTAWSVFKKGFGFKHCGGSGLN